MIEAKELIGGVMMVALVLYVLLGGADFGGGVWDLLAAGPRRVAQRKLIETAIGPIWEANHVWLILVVVLLFAAFPPAYAALTVALHVPLTLFLIGVVFRGSAFTFRTYDTRGDLHQRRWGLLFSLASVATPVLLGILVGTIASGEIKVENGLVVSGFFEPWLKPFPIAVGLFALSLFAFLAALYLGSEAGSPELANDFRKRALIAGGVVGVMALLALATSWNGAPRIRAGLTERPWTWPFHALTAIAAATTFWALYRKKMQLARFTGAAQTAFIVLGWGASQYPYLVVADLTLANSAGSPHTLKLLLIALAAGSVVLFPSLAILYRIFKGSRAFRIVDRQGDFGAPQSHRPPGHDGAPASRATPDAHD